LAGTALSKDFTEMEMQEKEINLRDYLRIIDKRRYVVLTFLIVVFTLALLRTLTATPLYTAATKVLIERSDTNPLMGGYHYVSYDPEFLETQTQIIKSSAVGRKVVKLLSLDETHDAYFPAEDGAASLPGRLAGWFGQLFETARKVAGVSNPPPEAKQLGEQEQRTARIESLARMISGGIDVEPVRESRIVNISFVSPNPEFATLIANSVAEAYIEELLEMRMASAGQTIKWMKAKADEERLKLEKAEQKLQQYMRDQDIVTIEDRVAIIPQKMAELSSELTRAETARKEHEALYAKVRDASPAEAETIPAVSGNPTVQSLRDQIIKAEQHIMELSKKYGPKHPVMKRARGDLNTLRGKKAQEIRRVVRSIKNEYDLARTKEEELHALLSRTKQEATNTNEKFIQYNILKREVEANRLLYDTLVQRMKEQSVTEQKQTVDVWVVEKAAPPRAPSAPNKMRNLLLAVVIGLFGGVGLAFFLEYLDHSVKTAEDAEERLRKPVLGMVPLLKDGNTDIEKIVKEAPGSVPAENYKAIRTSVLLSSAEKPPQSILVTSMAPEDGKTATAVNLAAAIAQSEKKVLLIDADLRRPRIHRIFGLVNQRGLSSYLAGASEMKILSKSSVNNLNILTAGPVPPNPSELLSSYRMGDLLRNVLKQYDFVLLDSPPIMTVTDSLVLSKIVEGTIMVVRSGRSTYDTVARGIKSLQDLNAHLLGLVINGLDIKKRAYYYDKYYAYGYGDNGGKR
jgi:capsular exopolysaccharide synthesis family protein